MVGMIWNAAELGRFGDRSFPIEMECANYTTRSLEMTALATFFRH